MKTSGFVLQILAWVVGIFGVIGGVILLFSRAESAYGNPTGIVVILSSLVSWALLYGIGKAFEFIEDMAIDARLAREANERAALALERLAQRQSKQVAPKASPDFAYEFPESSAVKPLK